MQYYLPDIMQAQISCCEVYFTCLRDTLLMLSSEKGCPRNSAGVFALEEERFGLAILEAEDFAVTTHVELPL